MTETPKKKYRATNDYVIITPELETEIETEAGALVIPAAYQERGAPASFEEHRSSSRIALASRTCVGRVVSVGPGIPPRDIDEEEWGREAVQAHKDGLPVPGQGDVHQRIPIDDIKPGDRVLYERTSAAYLPKTNDVIVRHEAVWLVLDDKTRVQTVQV